MSFHVGNNSRRTGVIIRLIVFEMANRASLFLRVRKQLHRLCLVLVYCLFHSVVYKEFIQAKSDIFSADLYYLCTSCLQSEKIYFM